MLSGIPVFQLSRLAGYALGEGKKVSLVLDYLPELDAAAWQEEIRRRLDRAENCMLRELTEGLVHPKLCALVASRMRLTAENKTGKLERKNLAAFLNRFREDRYDITGTGTFQEAQVTAGGVELSGLTAQFESVFCPGLYLAGELLDVDGICGGYNLSFAMCSGSAAGMAAASACRSRCKT